MVSVKQEPGSISRTSEMGRKGKAETGGGGGEGGSSVKQEATERRVLRSRYMNLKSIISGENHERLSLF
ncbi:hypothetical protein QJS04_geneDACA016294 [Acorus gramineus]|uniref:Uncharacterized protein n=1 Tax=Acorus gramineus TaxID=55184 RepID=A0AAV9APX9_ACOGR|nr:hypothetical protein QJS04_geneDACA016294 [Acorus gramineus]